MNSLKDVEVLVVLCVRRIVVGRFLLVFQNNDIIWIAEIEGSMVGLRSKPLFACWGFGCDLLDEYSIISLSSVMINTIIEF